MARTAITVPIRQMKKPIHAAATPRTGRPRLVAVTA
jgi:hypothetical protein